VKIVQKGALKGGNRREEGGAKGGKMDQTKKEVEEGGKLEKGNSR